MGRKIGDLVDLSTNSKQRLRVPPLRLLFAVLLLPNTDPESPAGADVLRPMGRDYPTQARLEKWVKHHRPEAVICVGPEVPLWIREAGLSIPQDISITDLCLADESGEIAGVFEMPQLIAATAVELVVEQIHHNALGVPEYPKSVLFNGKWVDGKTLPRLK